MGCREAITKHLQGIIIEIKRMRFAEIKKETQIYQKLILTLERDMTYVILKVYF